MPRKKLKTPKPHGPGRLGGDGLTDRERAFVRCRRAEPAAPGHVVAKKAGYLGDTKKLTKRASELLKKPIVAAAVYAPAPKRKSGELIDDRALREEIRRQWRAILNDDRTTAADKIRAGDKLMATIVGGYVPIQVKSEGTLTLEGFVARMGGAPDDRLLNGSTTQEEERELT